MSFHPDDVDFQFDIETTIDVAAQVSSGERQTYWHPGADAELVGVQVRVCGKWFDLEAIAPYISDVAVEEIRQIAIERHLDAEYDRRQGQLFGSRAYDI